MLTDPGQAEGAAAVAPLVPPLVAAPFATCAGDASLRALARANAYAIIALVLILLTISGLALWSSYQGSLREAETRAAMTSTVLAEQIDLSLIGLDSMLQGLGERLTTTGSFNDKAFSNYLARHYSDMVILRGVRVADADGKVFLDSQAAERGINVRNYLYFSAHLGQSDTGLYIGAPVCSSDGSSWSIPLSRAILSPDGSL
ncbi:MAG: hypothetical protein WCK65_08880, partial [Rhodospirillaceae bacterium]